YTGYINALTFSADGRYLAAADNNFTVRIWRTSDARLVQTFNAGIVVNVLAYSPSGSRLITGGGVGRLKMWDPLKGELIHEFAGLAEVGFGRDFTSLAFDTTGNTVISGNADR